MGNSQTQKATTGDEAKRLPFLKANNIRERHWQTFMLLLYAYMSCTGDIDTTRRRYRSGQLTFDNERRQEFEASMKKIDEAILVMMYNYNYEGSRITTRRSFSRESRYPECVMQFKKVENNKQKHTVPGYIHAKPYDIAEDGARAVIGINTSVKSIRNYEIRCVGVHTTVTDGWSSRTGSYKGSNGCVDIHLKAYGNIWDKPLILHLASYSPVIWHIYASKKVIKNCKMEEIFASAYEGSAGVELHGELECDNIVIEKGCDWGYGDDDGGDPGSTERRLANILYEYREDALSMIGTSSGRKIDVYVGNKHNFAKN